MIYLTEKCMSTSLLGNAPRILPKYVPCSFHWILVSTSSWLCRRSHLDIVSFLTSMMKFLHICSCVRAPRFNKKGVNALHRYTCRTTHMHMLHVCVSDCSFRVCMNSPCNLLRIHCIFIYEYVHICCNIVQTEYGKTWCFTRSCWSVMMIMQCWRFLFFFMLSAALLVECFAVCKLSGEHLIGLCFNLNVIDLKRSNQQQTFKSGRSN